MHHEANIAQAGRSEAIKKDASHITARIRGKLLEQEESVLYSTVLYIINEVDAFSGDIFIYI